MDGTRFDRLAMEWGKHSSRRRAVALIGGGALAGSLVGSEAVEAKKKKKCLRPGADLQAAIDKAKSGATLCLKPGSYPVATRLNISFKTLTLVGAGMGQTILDAQGGTDGVLIVYSATATVRGMTFTGVKGFNTNIDESGYGGGVLNAAGGTLTMEDCESTDNSAGTGAGVKNFGTLTMTNCHINRNTATYVGPGGLLNYNGTAALHNCTFAKNAGKSGGAIFSHGGTVTADGCTVTENTADESGGGIYTQEYSQVSLTDSTISGNTARTDGGGIDNRAWVTLTRSTVTGNSAEHEGGGIENNGGLTLEDSVITENTSPSAGGIRSLNSVACSGDTHVCGNSGEDCGWGAATPPESCGCASTCPT